jgi:hypothetical protein
MTQIPPMIILDATLLFITITANKPYSLLPLMEETSIIQTLWPILIKNKLFLSITIKVPTSILAMII